MLKLSKIKKLIFNLLFYVLLLKKAVLQYTQEIRYFFKAKKIYIKDIYPKNNPALFLRKRTHHLERYLMAPRAYTPQFAEICSRDIETILEREKSISAPQIKWARKILNEYKNKATRDVNVICPMLIEGVERQKSIVTKDTLMKMLRQRRSRRIFENCPLTVEQKKAICEAAQYAPSSCNRQTIDLIFVEDSEIKNFVASTIPGGRQFFSKAPCIVLFISDAGDYRYPDERMIPYIDAAAAIENIYLLCETIDLGCCWGAYSSFGCIDREKEVRKRLKIPETYLIVGSLAIGKSKQFVCDIPRDLPEKRFWLDYYGNR